ncbi:hypothetical protein LTR84_009706 [Exophiala bonariae]|uniref:Uncharacterized protein n=1 Tax=Exophiala bonariae TaxID=1690606 RepID=A0AAV9NJH3_9EURO|nr:hypothetical protein LTR84_009706 [Exophiala bonariae]
MESGLKKLWTRRKSRGIDGQIEPAFKGLRTVQSIDRKGLSSSKAQDRPIKTPQANASNQSGRPATTTDSSARPSSSRKVQPTLLGVSRPTTSPSRPGTSGSGSLLTAVNRAADAVSIAEQEFQKSAQRYSRNHIPTKSPRYLDIFSLSKPDSPQVYNEDIAERNLDLARVALDGSEPPLSPAKYQEEVAARNAFPPLPGESKDGFSPTEYRFHPAIEHQLGGAHPKTSTLSHQSLPRKPPNAQSITGDNRPQSASVSHFRQTSDQSRGSQPRGAAVKGGNQPGGSTVLHPRGTVPDTFHISSAMSPRSNRFPVPPSNQLFGAHVAQANTHEAFRGENLRNYVLSQSELIQSRSQGNHQHIQSSITRSIDGQDGIQQSDHSIRSPSALSNTSSVKRSFNRPHRKIMDLTGDDSEVFSERTSGSHYSSSPVVEHAKVDPLRRAQPTIISQTTKSDTNFIPYHPQSSSDSHHKEMTQTSIDDNMQQQPTESTVSTEPTPEVRPQKTIPASTFSPINTLAFVAPRRSVIEPRVGDAQAGPGQRDMNVKEEAGRSTASKDFTVLGEIKPLSQGTSALGIGPGQEEANSVEHGASEENVQAASVRSGSALDGTSGLGEHSVEQATEPHSSKSLKSTESPLSKPNIQTTPDSLHSIDFVDPSRAFGVTTRDFAISPTKATLESVPEDIETNPKMKSKQLGDATAERHAASHDLENRQYISQPTRNPSNYSSTFDEDEFAHKQAEARAALIRLQQSLDENFLTQPITQTAPLPNRTLRHHSSLSDGKPVAPSSIFAQVRNTSPPPADYRISIATSNSSEDARTVASYHNLTTIAQPNGQSNFRNSYSSSGSAEYSPHQSKGMLKYAGDPNGPGPSVIDHGLREKNPLPLPPPLHMNGTALYRNLNQPTVPPSPGEISLSSFPIPASSPRQSFIPPASSSEPAHQHHVHHSHQNSAGTGRILRRQSSQRSQASSASAFSIPYHMIPDRSSSARDRLIREAND